MSMNFNFKKTLDFISNLERQVNQIRMFGKKLSKIEDQSIQSILKIIQFKNEINLKSKDRSFKKQLSNIDYLVLEKEHSESISLWVNNYLQNWIKISQENIKELTEQAKQLQSKRLKKSIKQSDNLEFKNQLQSKTLEHKKSVQELIKLLSQLNIKNCCALVQNLTTIMQQIKNNQKKTKVLQNANTKGKSNIKKQ